MNHNSKNYTLAFFVLVVAIIVGIASLILVRPPIPATLGEFFPPVVWPSTIPLITEPVPSSIPSTSTLSLAVLL